MEVTSDGLPRSTKLGGGFHQRPDKRQLGGPFGRHRTMDVCRALAQGWDGRRSPLPLLTTTTSIESLPGRFHSPGLLLLPLSSSFFPVLLCLKSSCLISALKLFKGSWSQENRSHTSGTFPIGLGPLGLVGGTSSYPSSDPSKAGLAFCCSNLPVHILPGGRCVCWPLCRRCFFPGCPMAHAFPFLRSQPARHLLRTLSLTTPSRAVLHPRLILSPNSSMLTWRH